MAEVTYNKFAEDAEKKKGKPFFEYYIGSDGKEYYSKDGGEKKPVVDKQKRLLVESVSDIQGDEDLFSKLVKKGTLKPIQTEATPTPTPDPKDDTAISAPAPVDGSGVAMNAFAAPDPAAARQEALKAQILPQSLNLGLQLASLAGGLTLSEMETQREKELKEERGKIDPGFSDAEKKQMRQQAMAPVRAQITEQRGRQEALRAAQGGERSLGAMMMDTEAGNRAIADASLKVDEMVADADRAEQLREQSRMDRIGLELAQYEKQRAQARQEQLGAAAGSIGAFLGETEYGYTVKENREKLAEMGVTKSQFDSLDRLLVENPNASVQDIYNRLTSSGIKPEQAVKMLPLIKGK